MEIEIIKESEVVFSKRGRKANADPKDIEIFKSVKIGQMFQIKEMGINSEMKDQKEIANHKAKVGAQIRAIANAAGWEKVSVKWTNNGIPCVIRSGK
jgi:hypothetical protein